MKKVTPKNMVIRNYKVDPLLLIFVALTFITLVFLGMWQLNRLEEKKQLIELSQKSLHSTPKLLSEIDQSHVLYQKIRVKGRFLAGHDIYLYGRRSGATEKDGYYLVMPFMTEGGKVLMVARGWFSHSQKDAIKNAPRPEYLFEEISGVTLPGEKRKTLMPENDVQNQIWFTLDPAQASKLMGGATYDFYLVQTDPTGFAFLHPISGDRVLNIRNDHLEYAITWFSLASILVFMYGFYIYRR